MSNKLMLMGNRGPLGDPYADYIVYDTFKDVDGVLLPSHTPDRDAVGGGWANGVPGSEWQITSNKVQAKTLVGSRCWHYLETNEADVVIEGDLVCSMVPLGIGFVYRWADNGHLFDLSINSDRDALEIWKLDGGWTMLGQYSHNYQGATVHLKLTLSGTSHIVEADGVIRISITEAALAANTKHGIQAFNDTVSTIDNFSVT